MKRRDVIKTFEHVKISRIIGKPVNETNDWLHGIFVLLYGIAEALDVFDDEDEGDEGGDG